MESETKILNGLRHIAGQLDKISKPAPVSSDWKMHSEEIDKLATALVEFQGSVPTMGMDSQGYNYTYASYPAIRKHVAPYLKENGLAVDHVEDYQNGQLVVITILWHESGQWLRGKAPVFLPGRSEVPGNKEYYQEYGKAISYVKRYALENILGIKADKNEEYDHSK